jgi:hypothetical protein
MSLLCTEVVPIPRLRPDGTIEVVQRDASLEDRVNAIDMYFAYTLAVRPRPHEKGDRLIAQHVHRMGIMVAISRRLPDGARWIEQLVAAAWDELGRDPEPLVHPTGPRPPDLVGTGAPPAGASSWSRSRAARRSVSTRSPIGTPSSTSRS